MEQSKKTRHLSTYSYLQALQLEYIVAELRKKIYIKKKDKDFYGRVLSGKKKKIIDICLRNSLPSIFTSDEEKVIFYNQIYNPFGYPDFCYRNNEQVQEFKAKDFYYYYHKDSDFKVNQAGDIKIGTLVSVDEENEIAVIKLKGEEKNSIYPLGVIARII